jgi:hypothetical protein
VFKNFLEQERIRIKKSKKAAWFIGLFSNLWYNFYEFF